MEIYQTRDKQIQIEVSFEGDTVWLTQQQMAELFSQTKQNISLHINNCYKEKELTKKATVKESLSVRKEGNRLVSRKVEYYNLDVIISVGYRVKSKRGTQFRQWPIQRLKDHLVKGYSLNEKRLRQVAQNMQQLEQTVKLIQSGNNHDLTVSEAKGLLDIISSYTRSFVLLNQFDNHNLPDDPFSKNLTYEIQFDEAINAIEQLKEQLIINKEASDLFGRRKDDHFEGYCVRSCNPKKRN